MTDDPGGITPLTNALVGGIFSFLLITIPIFSVAFGRTLEITQNEIELRDLQQAELRILH